MSPMAPAYDPEQVLNENKQLKTQIESLQTMIVQMVAQQQQTQLQNKVYQEELPLVK